MIESIPCLQHQVGLSDHSLRILQSLYTDTECIVKCDQGTSQPFSVGCGLRQGCPLSTTLFNLFICDLHKHLVENCPGHGVKFRCKPDADGSVSVKEVTDLDYADDVALCGGSASHLQELINCFAAYCHDHGLIVNPKKCEVVVFAGTTSAWPGEQEWTAGDQTINRVQHFK